MEGMITVEEFSEKKGIAVEKVVSMIKSGFYSGRVEGEQWYVSEDEFKGVGSAGVKSSHSKYFSTLKISKIISVVGWIIIIFGAVLALVFVSEMSKFGNGGAPLIALVPALSVSFSGLLLVAAGHLIRVVVDIADNSHAILNHLKGGA